MMFESLIFKEYERAVIFRLGIIEFKETFDINKIKRIFPPICLILETLSLISTSE